jgi:hypothetical protein
MNQERLKLIVQNLDLLIQSLKKEIEDAPEYDYQKIASYIEEEDSDLEYYDEETDV